MTPTRLNAARRVARTLFQGLIGLAAMAPLIYTAASQREPGQATGYMASALLISAAITRVMAMPGVEKFLAEFLPFLAAEPATETGPPVKPRRARTDVPPLAVLALILTGSLTVLMAAPSPASAAISRLAVNSRDSQAGVSSYSGEGCTGAYDFATPGEQIRYAGYIKPQRRATAIIHRPGPDKRVNVPQGLCTWLTDEVARSSYTVTVVVSNY